MGTWGPQNLDNDYALDELHARSTALVASLLERARSKTSRECDDYDYTTLFVEFEIVFAFAAHGLLDCELPPPNEVAKLAAEYLRDWEIGIDKLGATAAHKRERRDVIERTFQRFQILCQERQQER
ncbi:MAG: hypothetical protein AAGE52_25190 [Myxococcota bacterium]